MTHVKIEQLLHIVQAGLLEKRPLEHILRKLSRQNIIPPFIREGILSNDRYTFVENDRMTELECANVQCFRMWWDAWQLSEKDQDICRGFVQLLPGQKCSCKACGWSMPQYEMQNETLCCFCHDKGQVVLRTHQKIPYLSPLRLGRPRNSLQSVRLKV